MKNNTQDFRDTLEDIHTGMAKLILARIKDGTATASDLSVARQFLRDNAMQAKPVKDSPLGNLVDAIPTFDEPLSYQ